MQTSSISIGGELTIEEAFARVLQGNLARVREWAPVALAGEDIEGVHQMRVCLRRMRSALSVFRTAIPKKATKSFSNEMRWAAKALDLPATWMSTSRKTSLQKRKDIKEDCARLPKNIVPKHTGRLRVSLRAKGTQSYARSLMNGSMREHGVKSFLRTKKATCKKISPLLLLQCWSEHRSRILEYGKEIEHLDSEILHQLRIECKKLRYATEFFSSLYGDHMKEFTGHLKKLQNLLGTLHDTAVMAGLQQDLLKNKKNKKLSKYTQKLERQRQKEAETILTKASIRWQDFSEATRPWLTIVEATA